MLLFMLSTTLQRITTTSSREVQSHAMLRGYFRKTNLCTFTIPSSEEVGIQGIVVYSLPLQGQIELHGRGRACSNSRYRSSGDLDILRYCASTDTNTANQPSFIVEWQPVDDQLFE